jgi:hypothetical protein
MKLNLNRVTAICIDGREIGDLLLERYKIILGFMTDNVDFGSIKFIGTRNPSINGVEFKEIPKIGITDYSKFCLFELSKHVQTDFCLLFQDDGFILNPNLWNECFYDYDYIGSPWPLYMGWPKEGEQVGNGGFSLRSKKWCEIVSQLWPTWKKTHPEDHVCCITNYDQIIANGLKIAPEELALKFSVENEPYNGSFGMHELDKTQPDLFKYLYENNSY